jgi:hypothetical protein
VGCLGGRIDVASPQFRQHARPPIATRGTVMTVDPLNKTDDTDDTAVGP